METTRTPRFLTTVPPKFLFGQPVALMHNEMKSDNSSNDYPVLKLAILDCLEEHPEATSIVSISRVWFSAKSVAAIERLLRCD
jgi:hypothetical protein